MIVENAVKKLLLFIGTVLAVAACSDATAPSSVRRMAPSARGNRDELGLTCRSGYAIAYDQWGNAYCTPSDSGMTAVMTSTVLPDSTP